jgi:hypothetical protein
MLLLRLEKTKKHEIMQRKVCNGFGPFVFTPKNMSLRYISGILIYSKARPRLPPYQS